MKARFTHTFNAKNPAIAQAKALNKQKPANYSTDHRFGVVRKGLGKFRVRVLTTKTNPRRIVWRRRPGAVAA